MRYWDSENDKIDIVYLWVNSNDEKWLKRKIEFSQDKLNDAPQINGKCRFSDNGELKYSLRSLEKYAPWINNIYIVTDEQVPNWLNTNHKKINMVFHKDLLPKEVQPCYCSETIEYYIDQIKGLSEYFLYSNDDMFFANFVTPEDFFKRDKYPIFRFNNKLKTKDINNNTYTKCLYKSQLTIKNKYGVTYQNHSHHNIDAYRKSILTECKNELKTELKENATAHFRNNMLLQRAIYAYYACATKQGHFKKISKIDHSLPIITRAWYFITKKYQKDSIYIALEKRNYYEQIALYNPKLFCINDTAETTDADRNAIENFLNSYFPEKSSFEI